MRSEQDMMDMFIDFAVNDDRIRLVTLEGSRTNKKIPSDSFQDFDISYFVTDMDSFKENDRWLDIFGECLMMQKPEDMELFPPELGNWFSYIILFEDGNKLDLTLIPINEVEDYFTNNDGLIEVLLDKDSLVKDEVIASDQRYWINKPTAREFDDCCNEFWMSVGLPLAWVKTINLLIVICQKKIGKHYFPRIHKVATKICGMLYLLAMRYLENILKLLRKALDIRIRIMMKLLRSIRRIFISHLTEKDFIQIFSTE